MAVGVTVSFFAFPGFCVILSIRVFDCIGLYFGDTPN